MLKGFVLAAVLAIAAFQFTVRGSDPRLKTVGARTEFKGQPFTGVVFDTFENHRLSFLGFVWRGQKTGTERQWYPEGGLWYEDEYAAGLPHGQWRMWYPDGKVKFLANYIRGEKHGHTYGWHANGQLSDLNIYDHGREISHKAWVADGTPFYNYVYQDGLKVGIKGGDFCKLRVRPGAS